MSQLLIATALVMPTMSFASANREEPEAPIENYVVTTPDSEKEDNVLTDDNIIRELDAIAEDIDGEVENDELAQQIIDYASTHVGRPYRYGSGGPKSFDCSGFTSYIFKNFGVNLTRSSRSQYNEGEKVAKEDIKPGDLLFFKGRSNGRSVGHVGIAVDVDDNGRVRFIHAATNKGVSYSTLDESYYAKRYVGARRVL